MLLKGKNLPYIKSHTRQRFENSLHSIMQNIPQDAGELNYLITRIIDLYIQIKGKNYANLNEVIGVVECVKLEYYRRIILDYENIKINENGDVYGKMPMKQQ